MFLYCTTNNEATVQSTNDFTPKWDSKYVYAIKSKKRLKN